MELKDLEEVGVQAHGDSTRNPFNGIESVHVELGQLMTYRNLNPFNGIERGNLTDIRVDSEGYADSESIQWN